MKLQKLLHWFVRKLLDKHINNQREEFNPISEEVELITSAVERFQEEEQTVLKVYS